MEPLGKLHGKACVVGSGPNGLAAGQIVTAVPPLSAIRFNAPSAADQYAIDCPSGENTGLTKPPRMVPAPISAPGIGFASGRPIGRRYKRWSAT